jgi:hypothetical protein
MYVIIGTSLLFTILLALGISLALLIAGLWQIASKPCCALRPYT